MSCEMPDEPVYVARMQVNGNTPYHEDQECCATRQAVRVKEVTEEQWERYDLRPCSYCCDDVEFDNTAHKLRSMHNDGE